MKKNKKMSALVLSLAMTALLALPTVAKAQGSLFGYETAGQYNDASDQNGSRGLMGVQSGESGLTTQNLGETVPVGCGLLILTAAGAGYVLAKKRKESK